MTEINPKFLLSKCEFDVFTVDVHGEGSSAGITTQDKLYPKDLANLLLNWHKLVRREKPLEDWYVVQSGDIVSIHYGAKALYKTIMEMAEWVRQDKNLPSLSSAGLLHSLTAYLDVIVYDETRTFKLLDKEFTVVALRPDEVLKFNEL